MTDHSMEATLAEFAAGLTLEDVAPTVVSHAKLLLVDAVGCAMAGDLAEETPMVRATAEVTFGPGEATVLGEPRRLSAAGATLLNAYLITAMTVCDVYRPAHCHMTPLVVPPALVATEEGGASGEAFLVGLIAGMEVMARVAIGLDYQAFRQRGWHSPGVIGPLGSAAAVASIEGFSPLALQHALGLAATQSAGSYLSWGTPAVKFHQARGAVSGLLAARLAGQGFVGGLHPLTAEDGGLYNTHSNGGDPVAATKDIGDRWELEQVAVRLWPGASPVQSMLTGLFDLIEQERLDADDVTAVEVGISTEDYGTHAGFGRPRGTFEALLSYAYLCAVALHDRQIWFEQVRPPRIFDPALAEFAAQRVTLTPLDHLEVNSCELTVDLHDGRRLTTTIAAGRGTLQNPASPEEVGAKFHRAADRRIGAARADEVLERLWEVESLPNLDPILRSLQGD